MNNKVNPNANNIFAFWQSNDPIPAYLDLCKDTWIKNIPNCEIHIINHSNVHEYIGDTYELENLKKISFAMQSDIISAAVLEKFGGLFLDIDCIVLDDLFSIFNHISEDKLISFGRPSAFIIHLAVLYCKKPNNPILAGWRSEAQKRLKNIPEKYDWSYFGGSIINPLLQADNHKNSFIIERLMSGNILETVAFNDEEVSHTIDNYKQFYFNEIFGFNKNILSLVKFGVISLHNSWTPPHYQAIKDKKEFLALSVPIAGMLDYVLNNDIHIDVDETIISVEAYVRNQLSKQDIAYRMKYFQQMLVVDFDYHSLNFAFDISYQDRTMTVDLVLRNMDSIHIKNHEYFVKNNISFNNSKCRIGTYQDKQVMMAKMLAIRDIIQDSYQSKTSNILVDNVYIDLHTFDIKDSTLFIDGIAFIEYTNIKEYSDIEYQLLFICDGRVHHKKRLAKAHDASITERFAPKNNNVSYDKCKFTTPQYAGIDISDISNGNYQLCLYIQAGKMVQIQPIRALEQKQFNNDYYQFECTDTKNTFIVKNITKISEHTNQKFKIEGNYLDNKNNKLIAPNNLHNCFVQFFGGNNEIIIDENANLRNCTLEMRENGKIIIKNDVGFHGTIRVGYGSTVDIGSNTTSTNPVYVTVAESTKLIIGEDCMFATNNQIRTDDAHPIYDINTGKRLNPSKDIVIGNHVWVGYGAVLFGGAQLGNGSVVGAFSMVNKKFPNNCIVAGTPAKIIKENVFWKRPLLLNQHYQENEIGAPSIFDQLTQHEEK